MGMMTSMSRMDVITNNMANVNTTGYKRNHVVSHAFSDQFLYRLNDPALRIFSPMLVGTINPGVFVDDVFTAFHQGSLQLTDAPLDIAVMGQGFFTVMRDGEELFTRDGTFTMANGMLMTSDGGLVQGLGGNINLPHGTIIIDENGRITVNGEYIETFRMTTFTDLHSLRQLEDNYFRVSEDSVAIPFVGSLHQGFLEMSNVNIVEEMVQMITLSRAFDTNSRMVEMQDGTLQHAVNSIARR